MFGFLKDLLRREEEKTGFREEWREILSTNVYYYRLLSDPSRQRLEELISTFLSRISFEGTRRLQVTDEMRVTIAAQACILALNRDKELYPWLRTIILYPSSFISQHQRFEGGVVHEMKESRLGESWNRGILVLSWSDSLRGGRSESGRSNLVFHEFAHQLDNEWVLGEGTPDLGEKDQYREWQSVMSREFVLHRIRVESGEATLIDPYGATNPAEFFAVLTELFFEEPLGMRHFHPDLYRLLSHYYRQDPAQVFEAAGMEREGLS